MVECAFLRRSRTAELADTEGRWFLSGCYRKAIVDGPDGNESALCHERRAFQIMGSLIDHCWRSAPDCG